MATSGDEEQRRYREEQRKQQLIKTAQDGIMQYYGPVGTYLSGTAYTVEAGTQSAIGVGLGSLVQDVSSAGMKAADKTDLIGPFSFEQMNKLSSVLGKKVWVGHSDGNYFRKSTDISAMNDWQEGYDKGYEDGVKKGKEG